MKLTKAKIKELQSLIDNEGLEYFFCYKTSEDFTGTLLHEPVNQLCEAVSTIKTILNIE